MIKSWSAGAVLLAGIASCVASPVLIPHEDQRDSAVDHPVTLQGGVSNSKIPTLAGVEIAGSPDLRGMPAFAMGWLRKRGVTQEDLDRKEKESGGIFAHQESGIFHYLVDDTGRLAQARHAP